MDTKVNDLEGMLIEEGRSAAARMSQTIDTMLKIARIESKEVELKILKISLCPFIEKIIADNKKCINKKQRITIDCPAEISVKTDPALLKEIVDNLLCNALKYTPEHGKIAIRMRKRRDKVIIDIQDSGYGIPLHEQKKIFQKFFRGDNVVGKDTDGTGLGLYLVFLITALLGGKISFVSKEGKRSGSTFTLRLPLSPVIK